MSKPHSNDEPEVTTYFQIQRNRDGLPDPGESKPAPVMPPLPASSPWSAENVLPDELPIDRTEDAANGGLLNMMEVDQ